MRARLTIALLICTLAAGCGGSSGPNGGTTPETTTGGATHAVDVYFLHGNALELPYAWFGTVEQICDKLRAARERWGISYFVMQKDGMEAMAPVVAQLAGT